MPALHHGCSLERSPVIPFLSARHYELPPSQAWSPSIAIVPTEWSGRSQVGEGTSRRVHLIDLVVPMQRGRTAGARPASASAANQQSRAAGFRALRRCWVAPAPGGLVDGADTTALLLAAGVNLANRGADRPSAPECCIAGADRQPLPHRPALDQRCQENRGRTTQTDTRSQRNRASRRGGHRVSTGSKPIVQTGPPGYVLQESPYPDQPTVSRGSDTTLTE